jgi:integrase/recombinase XerD
VTRTYLEPQEVSLMEKAATNLRDRLLIRLLFRLGCRVSEALALRAQDIDFEQGTVTILHLKERLRLYCPGCGARLARSHRFCPGCGKEVAQAVRRLQETRRQRLLPVDRGTLTMLREYVEHPDFARRVRRTGDDRLFAISRFQAWHIVRGLAHRVGLPHLVTPDSGRVRGVSPHRLRDAFAVNAIKHDDSGDGLRLLQEHLGHVSFNTTARYRKVAGEELQQWYEKLWRQK